MRTNDSSISSIKNTCVTEMNWRVYRLFAHYDSGLLTVAVGRSTANQPVDQLTLLSQDLTTTGCLSMLRHLTSQFRGCRTWSSSFRPRRFWYWAVKSEESRLKTQDISCQNPTAPHVDAHITYIFILAWTEHEESESLVSLQHLCLVFSFYTSKFLSSTHATRWAWIIGPLDRPSYSDFLSW